MNTCLILNIYRARDVWICRTKLWSWMKGEVYKLKVDSPDELLTRILDAAGCVTEREDQLRRTARDLRTRVAKSIEADGGISGY